MNKVEDYTRKIVTIQGKRYVLTSWVLSGIPGQVLFHTNGRKVKDQSLIKELK